MGNQVAENNPEWTGDYRDKKTQFIVASIRILGAWLAEESSSMKEEVCNVLPYIISICSRLFQERQKGSTDVGDPLRFMLPAFCHLAAENASRKIMLKENVHLSALQERLARSGRTLVPGHAVAQQRHAQPQLGGGIHRRFGLAQRDDEVA